MLARIPCGVVAIRRVGFADRARQVVADSPWCKVQDLGHGGNRITLASNAQHIAFALRERTVLYESLRGDRSVNVSSTCCNLSRDFGDQGRISVFTEEPSDTQPKSRAQHTWAGMSGEDNHRMTR
jgi:hypothetical protein